MAPPAEVKKPRKPRQPKEREERFPDDCRYKYRDLVSLHDSIQHGLSALRNVQQSDSVLQQMRPDDDAAKMERLKLEETLEPYFVEKRRWAHMAMRGIVLTMLQQNSAAVIETVKEWEAE